MIVLTAKRTRPAGDRRGIIALLAHPFILEDRKAPALAPYGVLAVARARRYQVGKFFNFERATLQVLQ